MSRVVRRRVPRIGISAELHWSFSLDGVEAKGTALLLLLLLLRAIAR